MKQKQWPGKWIGFCLLLALQMMGAYAYGQVKVSGKVNAPSGAGAESVTVMVKGTKSGAITDSCKCCYCDC